MDYMLKFIKNLDVKSVSSHGFSSDPMISDGAGKSDKTIKKNKRYVTLRYVLYYIILYYIRKTRQTETNTTLRIIRNALIKRSSYVMLLNGRF